MAGQDRMADCPNWAPRPLTGPWGVDYGKITPLLVKAIQDQQEMIEALQARIADLEEKLR